MQGPGLAMQQDGATRSGEGRRATIHAPPAASWLRRLHWRGGDVAAGLRDCLERELAERVGFHWLAVAFATGCLAYFALPREPLLLPLLGGAIVAAAIAARSYRRGAGWRVAAMIAVCLAGLSAAKSFASMR